MGTLIVKFPKDKCPNMPLFLYVWFVTRYIWQWYKFTVINIKTMSFGNTFANIKRILSLPFTLATTIRLEFNMRYKEKYKKYISMVK